jgi:Flp pilus assembly pilin Flp
MTVQTKMTTSRSERSSLAHRKQASREKGVTTVEYAIAAGLITVTLVGIFPQIGAAVTTLLQALSDAL